MDENEKQKIQAIGKGFNLTDEDSRALYYFSREVKPVAPVKTKTKATNKKITSDELSEWKDILKKDFADKEITNKLIAPRMGVQFGLTARQTPSRLTNLEKEGFLEHIEGTKPKAYRIVGD